MGYYLKTFILCFMCVLPKHQTAVPATISEFARSVPPCAAGAMTVVRRPIAQVSAFRLRGGLGGEEGDVQRALWYASMSGDEEACALLLRQGGDPDKLCCYADDEEDGPGGMARMIAAQGSPLGLCHTVADLTPSALQMAAIAGHDSLVRLFLEHGADVNGANDMGYTPLHYAALMGHLSVCEVLVEHGCNIAATDLYGDQAVDRAHAEKHTEIEGFLHSRMAALAMPRTYGRRRRWERGEELLEDMRAALNGSAWLKLGQGEEVLPASLLDAHGNADLEIGPPARIERFNALREMQRGLLAGTIPLPSVSDVLAGDDDADTPTSAHAGTDAQDDEDQEREREAREREEAVVESAARDVAAHIGRLESHLQDLNVSLDSLDK